MELLANDMWVIILQYICVPDSEKAMAPHSSTLAQKIPWTEQSGGLQSMGSLRVGDKWVTSLSLFTFMHWRRKWQLTPVFLPGESQGWGTWWAAIYGVTQSWTRLRNVTFTFHFHALEKEIATHSSVLAWRIPGTEESGGLQSMGSLRVGHDWATPLSLFTFMRWRRKWQPTPVFLPGESQGRGSLVGCSLWGLIEPDTTEAI